ncbi:MAG: YciI family protein [Acidobacteriia bacterium]|nr:YciI family protein [Terriglobia bacterium]
MRYMLLVYSSQPPDGLGQSEAAEIVAGHWRVMNEAASKGILQGAEPLAPVTTATTVRMDGGKALVTDGPFAETKEHLAGYYILECENLDEAIEWAAKIPTRCSGGPGCIEIRPLPGLPKPGAQKLDG